MEDEKAGAMFCDASNMKKEIRCTITGRVQMVMFRDFVARKAHAFDLSGTVQNRDDGSVRVIAQGEEENLTQLITYLHKGPFLARVARVDVEWREPSEMFQGFKILY